MNACTLLEERQRKLQTVFVAIADDDVHARVRERARNAEADAIGRRRDVRRLARDFFQRRRLRNLRLRRRRRTASRWRAACARTGGWRVLREYGLCAETQHCGGAC